MSYCNSCLKQIAKDEDVYCSQCHAPLHKDCSNKCLNCGVILCDSCYAENNFRCEECFKPENLFQTIRRSHIEQYAGCPYSLYLQLVLGIEPPMSKHAQLGVIVHDLIDKMLKGEVKINEALALLVDRVDEWNLSTEDEYSIITLDLIDNGENCLNNFELIKDNFTGEYKTEYNIKFSLDKNLPSISCTLDLISFKGDDIHVHDWKTGKPMSGKKLVTDLQPPLYLYSVKKEFGKMPESFNLHYLQPNKHIRYNKVGDMVYEIRTTKNTYTLDVEEALERTKDILKGIKNNKFNMPEDTHLFRCKNLCWFGISGKCKGTYDEQWKIMNEKYSQESV